MLIHACWFAGIPRVRVHRRGTDAKELFVPRVDPVWPDHTQVQLVVLRGLQVVQEAVRQQHPHLEELSADESAHVFLVLLGRTHGGRFRGRSHSSHLFTFRLRPSFGHFEQRGHGSGSDDDDHHHDLLRRSLRQRVVPKMIGPRDIFSISLHLPLKHNCSIVLFCWHESVVNTVIRRAALCK